MEYLRMLIQHINSKQGCSAYLKKSGSSWYLYERQFVSVEVDYNSIKKLTSEELAWLIEKYKGDPGLEIPRELLFTDFEKSVVKELNPTIKLLEEMLNTLSPDHKLRSKVIDRISVLQTLKNYS